MVIGFNKRIDRIIQVKVLRGFNLGGGKVAEPGMQIGLRLDEALVKQSQGKVSILPEEEITHREPQAENRDPKPKGKDKAKRTTRARK